MWHYLSHYTKTLECCLTDDGNFDKCIYKLKQKLVVVVISNTYPSAVPRISGCICLLIPGLLY